MLTAQTIARAAVRWQTDVYPLMGSGSARQPLFCDSACRDPFLAPQHASSQGLVVHRVQEVTEVYTLGKVLGRGQFGVTRLATDKATGEELACKSISKRKLLCVPALAHGSLIMSVPQRRGLLQMRKWVP